MTRQITGPLQGNLQVNDKNPTGPQHDNLHMHDKTTYKSMPRQDNLQVHDKTTFRSMRRHHKAIADKKQVYDMAICISMTRQFTSQS
jgi:hypothetical protein